MFTAFSVILFLYTVHAWISKVWIDGDIIFTKAFTGVRSLSLSEVNGVSTMKLRGRYLFFLMSPDKYVMISTMLENFEGLRELIKSKIPSENYGEIAKVSDDMISKARNHLKITLIVFAILYALLAVYFNFIR